MNQSPYSPPVNPAEPPLHYDAPAGTPKVWIWYKVYCAFMLLLYVTCLLAGIFMFVSADAIADQANEPIVIKIQGVVFGGIGCVLSALFTTALFLKPCKLSWYLGFAAIGLGMTSVCCLPMTIPLLISWMKVETKVFLRAMPGQS